MTVQAPPTQTDPRILFVQEEYGYRHWAGILPDDMTVESVIEWWKAQPSVMGMFFNPSKSFPMELYEVEDVAPDDADVAIMQWVDADGKEHILDRKNVVLFAHTHMEDDSYLKATKYSKVHKGEVFYHAGYGEYAFDEKEEDEEDLPPLTAEELEELRIKHPRVYKVMMENINGNDNNSTE
tara:strand:+ start:733 stop:1275 length:543 start_codon:yes stop_codon:yes gene_type:complete